jgi:hypothetical protein
MASGSRQELVREMRELLHDLCQPLTALQCRLEIAKIHGDPELLLETVEDSLIETRRLVEAIAKMRERLLSEEPGSGEEETEGVGHAGSGD